MSAKQTWLQSTKNLVAPKPSRGRAQKPIDCSVSESETPTSMHSDLNVHSDLNEAATPFSVEQAHQEKLLRAVISSQKQSISHFQKDLEFERNKVAQLEEQCRDLLKKVKSCEDYNAIRMENRYGYQGGYELGMAKVHYFHFFNFV